MQKRNVIGIEKVIHAATKRMQDEAQNGKGPTNKSLTALSRLLSSYTRATKAGGTGIISGPLSDEDMLRDGDPRFYDSLSK